MGGVNGFGPGPMRGAFSVGAGAVTVTVTVTVFSGAFASSRAQAALNTTIVRTAAAPAVARRRRVKRSDLILFVLSVPQLLSQLSPSIITAVTKLTRGSIW
jgi:hypothetical protein